MTRKDIIKELQSRGYKAEECNVVKNGVEFYGIRILTDSNIAPVIYTKEIIENAEKENKSLDEVVEEIITLYEKNEKPDFDVNELTDKDFILNHLFIGLQKESKEEIIKKFCNDFDGIESYLYIKKEISDDKRYNVKITKQLLESVGITEDEAWEQAQIGINKETTIESMAKVICKIRNMEYTEEMENATPFFVISNKSKVKGASAILNKKALTKFGEMHHTNKIVVLPSSIHEMILIPYTEGMDIKMLSEMVKYINSTQVMPEEQLTDKAYIITI